MFAAVEEAELVAPRPAPPPLSAPEPEPRPARRRRRRPEGALQFEKEAQKPPEPAPEGDHDPIRGGEHGLPVSVLVGLALLPFAIPIIWLIAPAVLGQAPVMSVATPIALAVSASILCLAIIYTIDWTPITRVKGVLILVTLSYFVGVSLYFLDKPTVDRIKKFFGFDDQWAEFFPPPPGNCYRVKLPAFPQAVDDQPLAKARLGCHKATQKGMLGAYTCVVGTGKLKLAPPGDPEPGTDEWFNKVTADIVERATGKLVSEKTINYRNNLPGRELEIKLGDGGSIRVVRIYLALDRIYYLAAEGPGLNADDDLARTLFDSFLITE